MRKQEEPRSWSERIAALGADALKPHLLSAAPTPVPTRGDFDLNPVFRPEAPRTLMPAAVLLPVVKRPEPTILFTRRTPHLARHAGQVSFPGGRANEADASLVETALRETFEETGIARSFVSVAGFLETYETGTGFAIVPVVGLLESGFDLTPDPGEVDEVFEVPLAFLLDPANLEHHTAQWEGRERRYYAFTYGTHHIWGATAAILVNFVERLARP
jgi:8-oxo-dGTP pyrophosphatase MutT (NUDIX family)